MQQYEPLCSVLCIVLLLLRIYSILIKIKLRVQNNVHTASCKSLVAETNNTSPTVRNKRSCEILQGEKYIFSLKKIIKLILSRLRHSCFSDLNRSTLSTFSLLIFLQLRPKYK